MLPLQATSLMAYKRLLYAMIFVNALGLYGRHGRLRFNSEVREGPQSSMEGKYTCLYRGLSLGSWWFRRLLGLSTRWGGKGRGYVGWDCVVG